LPNKPVSSTSSFDEGASGVDMAHPYLSPGLVPDELVQAVYPPNVAIYTCGWDQLLVEEGTFRERMRRLWG
jgi:acetyl esterase/lipase